MPRVRLHRSLVTRLVVCLVLTGIALSVGLGAMDIHRERTELTQDVTYRVLLAARDAQRLADSYLSEGKTAELDRVMHDVLSMTPVSSARISIDDETKVQVGSWNTEGAGLGLPTASLAEADAEFTEQILLNRKTLIRAPFNIDGQEALLEMTVDGPAAINAMYRRTIHAAVSRGLVLLLIMMVTLFMLRRWFTEPIGELTDLVARGVGADAYYRMGRHDRSEVGILSNSIAEMLERLHNTTSELMMREKAFQNLYQFAPAAMISINPQGRITDANRRAAELLGEENETQLLGREALNYFDPNDRSLLRQTIDRLELDEAPRAEMRLESDSECVVAVECVGVRNNDGSLQSVRLSLVDVTEARRLNRDLGDQQRLLNLVVNHMSDGILLIDSKNKVAACNRQMGTFLRARPHTIIGQTYRADEFWSELRVKDPATFLQRISTIESDMQFAAQEQVETHSGTFLFQGVPVRDGDDDEVARLWVVQEITRQVQNLTIIEKQTFQLQALKQLGQQLFNIETVEELLVHAGKHLFEIFGVEACGVALRYDTGKSRSKQIVNCGAGPVMIDPMQSVVRSIEHHLMPQILSRKEVTLWPELPPGNSWVKPLHNAGYTSLAGAPLIARADAQGMIWIARKGGEPMDVQHIYLLEAIAPLLAARLEIAELSEHLTNLRQLDPITRLPNEQHVKNELKRLENKPGHTWSLITLKVDKFSELNESLGHQQADSLLHDVGVQLRQMTRKSCFIGRLTGPSFAVICPNLSLNHATAVAQRLRIMIEKMQPESIEQPVELTASFGVASTQDAGKTGQAVYDAALGRMEMARQDGANQVVSGQLRSRQAV